MLQWLVLVLYLPQVILTENLSLEQEAPPELINFILEAKISVCGVSSRVFIFLRDNSSKYYNFENVLLSKLDDSPLIVTNDIYLPADHQLDITCSIFFTSSSMDVDAGKFHFRKKSLFIIEQDDLRKEDMRFNSLYIVYGESYRQVHYIRFADWEHVTSDMTAELSGANLLGQNLRRRMIYSWKYPLSASTSIVDHFWQTMAKRHNFSYLYSTSALFLEFSDNKKFVYFVPFSLNRVVHDDCFLVPIASLRPLAVILMDPFDSATWGCILAIISTFILLSWAIERSFSDISRFVFEAIQIVFSSAPRAHRTPFERHIITIFTIGNMILLASYQSLITASITKPSYYPPINTLDQINNSCEVLFRYDSHQAARNFNSLLSQLMSPDSTSRPTCFALNCHVLDQLFEGTFVDCTKFRKATTTLNASPVLVAPVLNHDLLDEMVQFYASAFAEGALSYPVERERSTVMAGDQERSDNGETRELTVPDLLVVWKLLGWGWLFSGAAFIAEVLYSQMKKCWKKFMH